jgi:hypothetical protein
MPNPEDDVLINLRASFTRDEAVAQLLGWMRGPIFPRNIEMDRWGIPESQLPYVASLQGSLQEHLTELREAARQRLLEAAELYAAAQTAGTASTIDFPASMGRSRSRKSNMSADSNAEAVTLEMLSAKEDAVRACDKLILRAQVYLNDIEEEHAKGGASVLQIDQEATAKTSKTHFTATSIDRWSRQKYRISIIDTPKPEELEDDQEEYLPDVRNDKGGLTRKSADSLFVSFAVLLECFLEVSDDDALGTKDAPVVAAIARHLNKKAKRKFKSGAMAGQSRESIKDRIEEARGIKAKHELQ